MRPLKPISDPFRKPEITWELKPQPQSQPQLMDDIPNINPNASDIERWKSLFKAPFHYDKEGTYIFDADGNMVLQVRGWGRISSMHLRTDVPNPEGAQDAFANVVVGLLNNWFAQIEGGGECGFSREEVTR